MSRLLQVIIALVGLAITGVLGLSSERSESLQARHTLIGLFTETVATARTTCDGDLAEMAQFALSQLEALEAKPRLFLTPEDRADRDSTQALLAEYQDIMARVKGTIDSGSCRATVTPTAPTDNIATADPAPTAPPVAAPAAPAPATAAANVELRRAERLRLPSDILLRPGAPTRDAGRSEEAAAPAQADGYYAVLASYPIDQDYTYDSTRGVVAHFRRLQAVARQSGETVQVFQTHSSNHFAIVLVPEGRTRDNARSLVAMARARGWSREAFVQAASDWTACAQPEQISRRQACAATRQ